MRADEVAPRIRHWQERLGLSDWDVRYVDEPPGPDDRARIDAFPGRRMAVLRISADAPPTALDRIIVHELLHLWLAQLQELVRPSQDFTPPLVDQAFERDWDRLEHQMIHALEGALTGLPHVEFGSDDPLWSRAWGEGR